MSRTAVLVLTALALLPAAEARGGTPAYPDLRTLPPRDLQLDRTDVSAGGTGDLRNVLRFTNTVVNAGEGDFELRAAFGADRDRADAVQWVLDASGEVAETVPAGGYSWHEAHQHYHYDQWGRYELWTRAAWDEHVRQGRPAVAVPDVVGSKTSSCAMDLEFVAALPATPWPRRRPSSGCFPDDRGRMVQGISVGWGDTYHRDYQEQWVDLGQARLADGEYVLRAVADPFDAVRESAGGADPAREAPAANEGLTAFRISGGALADSAAPTGSVWVNGVDATTASTQVRVRVLGRDDVSGVRHVRLSNDGVSWATYAYGGAGHHPMVVDWDLADSRYGGSTAGGTRTVHAQVRDESGRWSPTITDTIAFTGGGAPAGGSSPAYAAAVLADGPVSYWRLGDPPGTNGGADETGRNGLRYVEDPALGAAGLLRSDPADAAVALRSAAGQYADTMVDDGLVPGDELSVEAWIDATALPAAGERAPIVSRPDSYALQLAGPVLEWVTHPGGGAPVRLQAPAGAVAAGRTHHVVGTYDGARQRLYVDGALVASVAAGGRLPRGYPRLHLGSDTGDGDHFDGRLDEVAIYPARLTAVEVKDHHDLGVSSVVGVRTPTALAATAAGTSAVDLRWDDNADDETGHVVQRSTAPDFSSAAELRAPADATGLRDTGLAAGTTYHYRVRAVTATDASAWSGAAAAATDAAAPQPVREPAATPTPAPTPEPVRYVAQVDRDAPVSHWRLDETGGPTAADRAGAGHGVFAGRPVLGAAGLVLDPAGGALALDGIDDAVRIPGSKALDLTRRLTLEAWVAPAAYPARGRRATLVAKPRAYALQFNGSRLEFSVWAAGARRRLLSPVRAAPLRAVSHVAATYDASRMRLFVDGRVVAHKAQTGGAAVVAGPLAIGAYDGAVQRLRGTLDEVAIYGDALRAARVRAHTHAGDTGASASRRRRHAQRARPPRRGPRAPQGRAPGPALRTPDVPGAHRAAARPGRRRAGRPPSLVWTGPAGCPLDRRPFNGPCPGPAPSTRAAARPGGQECRVSPGSTFIAPGT